MKRNEEIWDPSLHRKQPTIHTLHRAVPADPLHRAESVDKFAFGDLDDESLKAEADKTKSWSSMTNVQRVGHVSLLIFKVCFVLTLLYFFICSLNLLSLGFRIVGGSEPQKLLKKDALQNPVVGLMCGILFTIVVQSSSTTTSAIVGMVAGKIISVQVAIPIVMGANIGTSVTNTLLAMLQAGNRDRFRRAFAAATVHDMFNCATTIVLLPVECVTGYLFYTTNFIVSLIDESEVSGSVDNVKLVKALTDPLTNRIVKLDKNVASLWSSSNETVREMSKDLSIVAKKGHVFADTGWSDKVIGAVIISASFLVLLLCLFLMVHTLKSLLKGKLAIWIRRTSQGNLPYCPSLTDYLLILMGAGFTFLIQSSSVFTSTLPPLVSVRALTIERAYCLTLGSNIGTTTTALIAALAQTKNFKEGLQIALCHLLFNLTGILLFFPLPWTRFPIRMAKVLGNTTAQFRWFAVVYVLLLFCLLPLLFMGLAFAGSVYVITVALLMIACFLFIVTVNWLREYKRFMPECLQTWKWLPVWLRSLQPYDDMFAKCACCDRFIKLEKDDTDTTQEAPESVMKSEAETTSANDFVKGSKSRPEVPGFYK